MARSGISYADVSKAAETVRQNNEEPTVDRVRAVLGTGSKSTIAPLLKKWRVQSDTDTEGISGIPKALSDAVQSLCEQARAAAETEFVKKEAVLTQQYQDVVGKLNDANHQLASVKEENQSLCELVSQLKAQLSDSQALGTRLQTECVQLQADLNQTQTRLTDAKETAAELKAENKDVRAHFEHFQYHLGEERQRERDEHANRLQAERERNTAIHQKLESLRKELDDNQVLVNKLTVLNAEQKTSLKSTVAECQAANAKIQQFKDEKAMMTQALQTTTEQLNEVKEEGAQWRLKVRLADKENEMLHAKVSELDTRLEVAISKQEKLNDQLALASHEKAVLQGQFIQLQNSLLE